MCLREGALEGAGNDAVDEINMFDGRQNRITFEQVSAVIKSFYSTPTDLHKDVQVHIPATDVSIRHPGNKLFSLK